MAAWGGAGVGAWGRGKAASAPADDAEGAAPLDENKTCSICMDTLESVCLMPCRHKICDGCLAKLRQELIKKVAPQFRCHCKPLLLPCNALRPTGFASSFVLVCPLTSNPTAPETDVGARPRSNALADACTAACVTLLDVYRMPSGN